jgi:quercetin dioxygenase-like cupin family protein
MTASAASTKTEPIWFIDNLARVHIDAASTHGAFSVVELAGRQGDMPPLHVHRREDEGFYVLDGRLSLFIGRETRELSAGEAVLAPRDIPHIYRVESESARWLALCAPAGFEQFIREAGEPAGADELPPDDRPHDPARLAGIAARYGVEILGPPGALPTS